MVAYLVLLGICGFTVESLYARAQFTCQSHVRATDKGRDGSSSLSPALYGLIVYPRFRGKQLNLLVRLMVGRSRCLLLSKIHMNIKPKTRQEIVEKWNAKADSKESTSVLVIEVITEIHQMVAELYEKWDNELELKQAEQDSCSQCGLKRKHWNKMFCAEGKDHTE